MSNLSKLEFLALDISGKNYLSWILDAEVHLSAASLGKTIIEGNKESLEDRSKALIFLRRHLDEALKAQYLTVKDPYTLWTELKGRFDHQKSVILPRARYEWMHLRLQDFKSVSEYNSALFQIVSRLKLCGETVSESDLLEKTYSTFHASNIVLQQQYRERRFTKYSELISCLLVAEQNNELLMQNHHIHPTGSAPVPEVNAVVSQSGEKRYGHRLGPKQFNNKKKAGHNIYQKKGKMNESLCHRCDSSGHWANVCRTPKHLVDLYKASLQAKGKDAETNFAQYEVPMNNAHLDICEFKNDATGNGFDDIGSFIDDV